MQTIDTCKNLLKNRFFKNLGTYTIASYVNKVIPFFMLPILTRCLTTEEYGIVSMFNVLVNFLIPFTGMGIDSAFTRTYYESSITELKHKYSSYIAIIIATTLITVLLFLIFDKQIVHYSGVPNQYIFWAVVTSSFITLIYCTNNYLQAKEEPFKYAIFVNLSTFVNALLSIVLVVSLRMGSAGRIYGIVITDIIFGFAAIAIIWKNIGFSAKVDFKAIKEEIIVFGIPLIPISLKGSILSFADKIFITNIISLSASGVYNVSNQLAMVMEVFVRSISLAYTPWFYRKLTENTEQSKRQVIKITYLLGGIMIIVSIIWIFVSNLALPLLVGEEFYTAGNYTMWLVISKLFLGFHLLVVNYVYFTKKIKIYTLISFISIAVNVFLDYEFINNQGTLGAAKATALVYMFTFFITWILAFNIKKMPWKIWKK